MFLYCIAVFMSEDGVECVTTHKEEILACINNSVPEVFNTYNNLNTYKMHFYVFQQGNCRWDFLPTLFSVSSRLGLTTLTILWCRMDKISAKLHKS